MNSEELKAVAEGLARVRPSRTPDEWLRLAYRSVREDGPHGEVEDRMGQWLHDRACNAQEFRGFREEVRTFRNSGHMPADAIQAALDRLRSGGGGISTEVAKSLGYDSVKHFYQVQRQNRDGLEGGGEPD
jgi:hypothetical protein